MQWLINQWVFYQENMSMLMENDANWNPLYVWMCKMWNFTKTSEPVRRIQKITYWPNWWTTEVSRADGDDEMNNVRDDRATLSYS